MVMKHDLSYAGKSQAKDILDYDTAVNVWGAEMALQLKMSQFVSFN